MITQNGLNGTLVLLRLTFVVKTCKFTQTCSTIVSCIVMNQANVLKFWLFKRTFKLKLLT